MKKTFLALLVSSVFLTPNTAIAGEHLAGLTWTTNNLLIVGLEGEALYAQRFDLDIGMTKEFYTVNGSLDFTGISSGSMPCTGSGYESYQGSTWIGMNCGSNAITIILTNGLSGMVYVSNYDGLMDSGSLNYSSIRW